jgi:hypothetical protein
MVRRMGEEKSQELKIVDVNFKSSFKFWLAYLVVQVIAMLIVFGIMTAMIGWISTIISKLPYPPPGAAFGLLMQHLL